MRHALNFRIVAGAADHGSLLVLSGWRATIAVAAQGDLSGAAPLAVPARFKGAAVKTKARPAPVSAEDAAWWGFFHDRALDALEVEALTANQDLRQAVARVVEARQQTRIAAAEFYPHLEAPLRADRQRTTNTGSTQRGLFVGNVASTIASAPAGSAPLPLPWVPSANS